MRFIVSISGKANSGKDTVANLIMERIPASIKMSFGDAVKDVACEILNVDKQQIEHEKRDDTSKMRTVLQSIGHGCRQYDPDVWIRKLRDRIQQHQHDDAVIIIPDVRYPNELEFIRSLGQQNKCLFVSSPDHQCQYNHESETALNDLLLFDNVIYNHDRKSLTPLVDQIENFLTTIYC